MLNIRHASIAMTTIGLTAALSACGPETVAGSTTNTVTSPTSSAAQKPTSGSVSPGQTGATRSTTGAGTSNGGGQQASPRASATSAAPSKTGAASQGQQRYVASGADWSRFTSPSGTIRCFTNNGNQVYCLVPPSAQDSTDGNNTVQLTAGGVSFLTGDGPVPAYAGEGAEWAKSTPAAPKDPNATPALPYGATLVDGAVTCKSATSGMTCTIGEYGFTVNSRAVTKH